MILGNKLTHLLKVKINNYWLLFTVTIKKVAHKLINEESLNHVF